MSDINKITKNILFEISEENKLRLLHLKGKILKAGKKVVHVAKKADKINDLVNQHLDLD